MGPLLALDHAGAADVHWQTDTRVVRLRLAKEELVFAEVVAVVTREKDKSVVDHVLLHEPGEQRAEEVVQVEQRGRAVPEANVLATRLPRGAAGPPVAAVPDPGRHGAAGGHVGELVVRGNVGILELHDLWIVRVLHRRARADCQPHREAGVRVAREEALAEGVLVRVALERLRPVASPGVNRERGEMQEEGLLAALGQLDLLDRLPGEEVGLVVARVDDLLRLGLVDELAVQVVPRPLRRVVVVAAKSVAG